MGKLKRLIASMLLVTFMTTSTPLRVYAQEVNIQANNTKDVKTEKKEEIQTTKKILDEVKEKREANIKHFLLEDKTYEAIIYNESVHYIENGQWKDIDNTLIENTDEELLNEDLVADERNQTSSTNIGKDTEDNKNVISNNQNNSQITDNKQNGNEQNNKIQRENNTKNNDNNSNRSSEKKNTFQNIANNFKLNIAKKADSKKLVRINKDKYEISWGIQDAQKSTSEVVQPDEKKLNNLIELNATEQVNKNNKLKNKSKQEKNKEKETIIENEKKKTLSKISSEINYKNIFPDIDLNYSIVGDQVKENFIINKVTDKNEFVFNLNIKNLVAVKQENNTIIFYDEKDQSKAQFMIAAPYMYDSNKEQSKDIEVVIEKQNNGYKLTYRLNKNWLQDANRKYPVTLDPIIETSLSPTQIYDNFIGKGVPDQNYILADRLSVGYGNTSKETRTLISFNLPTLTSADIVTSARLSLYLIGPDSYSGEIDIHKVTSGWNTNTVTWNNQPQFNPEVEDYQIMGGAGFYYWDVTGTAKDWYNTGANNGLLVKHKNENPGYANINDYYSSDTSSTYANGRPQVSIAYVNNSGLEDYWTYHSQDVGRAGTGYVNDYNGNLIFTENDLSLNGNRMPINITHVYNSNFRGPIDPNNPNYSYGNGWRLNLNQRVYSEVIQGTNYYVYVDGDGTKHYFKYDSSSAKWKDESGIDITLTVNNGTTGNDYFIIKDKKDNKLTFYSGGNLNQIIDNNNNTLTVGYTGPKITSVTDGAGRIATFNVDSNGYLTSIVFPKSASDPNERKIIYSYTGNLLTKITYPDGKSIGYSYDSNGNLTEATDIDGYKIKYDYTIGSVKRVSKISEFYKDGVNGQTLDVNYGNNITTYVDFKNRKNIFQFNNQGNTVCITEPDGSAYYFDYGKDANKNKMALNSKMQKSVMNYVINHNVEDDSDSWYPSNVSGSTGTIGYDNTISYYGNRSIKITKTNNTSVSVMQQGLNLEKGKTYTLSGYIRTENISNINNGGASLYINYKDNNRNVVEFTSKKINGTSEWNRYETSITIPSDASTDQVYFGAMMSNETGVAYFDGFQLEEGKIASRYNLVENPNFILNKNSTARFWTAENLNYYDGVTANNDSNYPVGLDNSKITYRLDGFANRLKTISQSIKQQGKKGDVFVAAAWAKAHSVPTNTPGRYFGIDVRVVRKDGSIQYCYFPFNEDSLEWQYKSGKIITDSDYSEIRILGLYCNNSNTAYFDGFQLYKEEFGQSYQYDSKGNIISTTDLNEKNSQFEYNDKNDLIKSVDPKGNNFKNEYDTKHNLTKATTAENVIYSFSYDSNGNPLTAEVSDANGTNKIKSTSIYDSKGNYIKSLTDSSGNTVNFNHDEYRGNLKSVTDAKGKTTNYEYDVNTDALKTVTKSVGGINISNSYTYENDRIKTINHNGFNYTFDYDNMGNNSTVSVGSQKLITNTYESKSRNLLQSVYGNNEKVTFTYDELDRIKGKRYNADTTDRFTYSYDESGNLGYKYDAISNLRIRYIYDVANRLAQVDNSDGSFSKYSYDSNNNLSSFSENLEGYKYANISNYKSVSASSSQDTINFIAKNVTDSDSLTRWASGTQDNAYIDIDLGMKTKISRVELNWETAFAKGYDIQVSDDKNTWTTIYSESNGNGGIDDIRNINAEGRYIRMQARLRGTSYYYSLYDFNVYTLKSDVNNTFNRYLDKSQVSKISKGMAVTASSTQSGSTFYPSNVTDDNVNTRWSSDNLESQWIYIDLGSIKPIDRVVLNWEAAYAQGYNIQVSDDKNTWTTIYSESNGNGGIDDIWNLNSKGRYVKMLANKRGTPYYFSLWEFEVYSNNNVNTIYSYDKDNRLIRTTTNTGAYVSNTYDSIGRKTNQSINVNGISYNTNFTFKAGISGYTTQKIDTMTNGNSSIAYTYDANGNIETITQDGKVIKYYYNELNELIREDNAVLDKTIVYSYDVGGNIKSKTEYAHITESTPSTTATATAKYIYDTVWKDKLKYYNDKEIKYDLIGNPTSYYLKSGQTDIEWNLSWEAGRQLKEIKNGTKNIAYKYNDSGIRTEKIVDGVKTTYHLVGDKVTFETNGTDNVYYTYDSAGKLVSMNISTKISETSWSTPTEYFYVRNAQGDIIGLIDKSGTQVVTYTYDSWGKPFPEVKDANGNVLPTSGITGSLASTVGVKNPYRYRGYRYDTETGLYYLQSRYYNPEWGRFINADAIIGQTGELLGHNMFAYCKNNPVNRQDKNGFRSSGVIDECGGMDAPLLDIVDNYVSSPAAAAVVTKPDGILGTAVGKMLTKSKRVMRDGTLGIDRSVKHPGLVAKFGSKFIKSVGVIGAVTMTIGIANNFINYEHSVLRTITDLGCFGVGFWIGIGLASLNPVTLAGVVAVAGAGIAVAGFTAWADNEIKNTYLSERKR